MTVRRETISVKQLDEISELVVRLGEKAKRKSPPVKASRARSMKAWRTRKKIAAARDAAKKQGTSP